MGGWRRPVDVFPSPDWVDRRLRPYAIGLLCDEAQISAGSRSAIVEIPDAVPPAVQVPCIVHVGSGVPWPREVLATTTSHDIRTTNGCQERQPHTSFYPAATYTASETRVDRQLMRRWRTIAIQCAHGRPSLSCGSMQRSEPDGPPTSESASQVSRLSPRKIGRSFIWASRRMGPLQPFSSFPPSARSPDTRSHALVPSHAPSRYASEVRPHSLFI